MSHDPSRYRIRERLGAGGMAEVFKAELHCLPGLYKQVALKRVLPRLAQDERFIKMFIDEARLGLLLDHSCIVRVFDVGHAGDAYFLVMEYVEGISLKDVLEHFRARKELIPLHISMALALEICKALDYAHTLTDAGGRRVNIVHHDVNPANVLLSQRGEVKLADFGLAEAATNAIQFGSDMVRGKFGYLAPEKALGQRADARSDLFALGLVLYVMITGYSPFLGRDDMESLRLAQAGNVPSPSHYNPNIPRDLEDLLMHTLARDPSQRISGAQRFGQRLTDILFDHGVAVSAFTIADMVQTIRSSLSPALRPRQTRIAEMIQEELKEFESLHSEGEG
jgi:serine/threonine protein kinase